MIISASRRTDIPAFFGDWFMKRIEEGYFYRVNPFNPNQVSGFSLKSEDIDAIVFWTKNPQPFIKHLKTLDEKGYHYYFQFTLNDYPKALEPYVPSIEKRIDIFQTLSRQIGADKLVWRYDPILISNITPISYHIDKLNSLASQFKGYTHKLVISFMDFYNKTEKKIEKLEKDHQIIVSDITLPEYKEELEHFANVISEIGAKNQIRVETCAEALDLDHCGISHGSCIDANLISRLFNLNINYRKDKNQRGACLCTESVDMGVYNTCKFNCVYCYAVQSENAVNKTLKKHNPDSASLIHTYEEQLGIRKEISPKKGSFK
ncbi:DUF1848 domain-containing protein [Paenibacillus lentus]|uniref:DUF1848 domain-containing protein n=1 Tax=Paenibacillus lentus TaxID=1338368 RepID=UPI00365B8FD7